MSCSNAAAAMFRSVLTMRSTTRAYRATGLAGGRALPPSVFLPTTGSCALARDQQLQRNLHQGVRQARLLEDAIAPCGRRSLLVSVAAIPAETYDRKRGEPGLLPDGRHELQPVHPRKGEV